MLGRIQHSFLHPIPLRYSLDPLDIAAVVVYAPYKGFFAITS